METSAPLLKFRDGVGYLEDAGVQCLQRAEGAVYTVILIGDGRAGKSYLGSRLVGVDGAFLSSSSAESVTSGIDVFVTNFSELAESAGVTCPGAPTQPSFSLVVLDCEGGNNAMAAIRTLVNVLGLIIGVQVLFATGGTLSESAVSSLDATVSARQLIRFDDTIPDPALLFVVNKNTLEYKDDALECALHAKVKDEARKSSRAVIKMSFSKRKFLTIPDMDEDNFEESVVAFRRAVLEPARPLQVAGVNVNGGTLVEVMKVVVEQMQSMNEVRMPSMNRAVLFDGFLVPLVEALIEEAEEETSGWSDYFPEFQSKDIRVTYGKRFEKEAAHLKCAELKEEARQSLAERLAVRWDVVAMKCNAAGEVVVSTRAEQRRQKGGKSSSALGGQTKLRRIAISKTAVQAQTRSKSMKRNGQEVTGEWTNVGGTQYEVREDMFTHIGKKAPIMDGILYKASPSCCRLCCFCGCGSKQIRRVAVREGFIMWVDEKKIPTPDGRDSKKTKEAKLAAEISGSLNLWLNQAEIRKTASDSFEVVPADPSGWSDCTSFSGGSKRRFVFHVGKSREFGRMSHPADKWVSAVKAHIVFAARGRKQLKDKRVLAEIGTARPRLSEFLAECAGAATDDDSSSVSEGGPPSANSGSDMTLDHGCVDDYF